MALALAHVTRKYYDETLLRKAQILCTSFGAFCEPASKDG